MFRTTMDPTMWRSSPQNCRSAVSRRRWSRRLWARISSGLSESLGKHVARSHCLDGSKLVDKGELEYKWPPAVFLGGFRA